MPDHLLYDHLVINSGASPVLGSPFAVGDLRLRQAVPAPRLEVFLSHSTADLDHVILVSRQIEALGIDVYLAEHDPKPGTSIAQKVDEALKRSGAVVVLITTTSVNSAYVQQEIGLASLR